MNHRHLLPDEIDLLVDGDARFSVAPLRNHLAECDDCAARVAGLGAVTHALDALPYHAPRLEFSDNVLKQVQVIEPWHVAAIVAAKRLMPTSAPMRVLAGAGAGMFAVVISLGTVWLVFRADLAAWAFSGGALGVGLLAVSALAAAAGFRRLAATARAKRS